MSAWTVSRAHIAVLVEAMKKYNALGNSTPDHAGQVLWDENYRSVNYRYSTEDKAPIYCHASAVDPQHLRPGAVLKALDCYDYQSCESDDWKKTAAYSLSRYLRDGIVASLDGYKSTPWGIPEGTHAVETITA